ncbi:hypothetical protein Hs30E_18510 [Lactococcus hodotermopsidis]|uniref:Sigma factor regulator C-terminal domain-containing protein n=1 Tax=Pseudolactococcus hodotermopsidis TaxID=2709157 RepID=A0A6A0BCZ9_9LACT|nr:anti sigma factor C-terminal domain-containing protein [Lactococcus hodotermopsidis]GFH43300.1 hypothetical protein Hs30E_18510 [Lactococcus hodotermopsidis]
MGKVEARYNLIDKVGKADFWEIGDTSYPEGGEMTFYNPNTTYEFITIPIQKKAIKEGNYTKKYGKRGSSWSVFPEDLYQAVSVPNDLANVVKTEKRVVEVGISFDKPYTYEEVKKMLPNNLMQAWYWVN